MKTTTKQMVPGMRIRGSKAYELACGNVRMSGSIVGPSDMGAEFVRVQWDDFPEAVSVALAALCTRGAR